MDVVDNTITINIVGNASDALKKINSVSGSLRRLRSTASRGIIRPKIDTSSVTKATSKVSALSKILSSLKRIAFYRMIRSAIKSVMEAFKEGLEWSYTFSNGVKGEGHRFAQAMNTMTAASYTMKAQLGSAFISLLTAVQPILTTLINLVTKVADAMSQLFSAFSGSTYLRAKDTSVTFADTMKSGANSAKEWKNQLMGFDEINRLEAPTGSGSGSGSNIVDPSVLYEVAELSPIFQDLKGRIDEIREAFHAWWTDPSLENFVGLVGQVLSFVLEIDQGLMNLGFDNVLIPIGEFIDKVGETFGVDLGVADFLRDLKDNLNDMMDALQELVENPSKQTLEEYASALGKVFGIGEGQPITEFFKRIDWAGLWNGLWEGMKTALQNMNLGIIEWFQSLPGKLSYWAGYAVGAIARFFVTLPFKVWDWFNRTLTKIKQFPSKLKEWADEKVEEVADSILQWFEDLPDDAFEIALDFIAHWDDGLWKKFDELTESTGELIDQFKQGFSDAFGDSFDPIKDWWDENVAPWFTWDKWEKLGRDAVQGIKNGLNSITLPQFHLSFSYYTYYGDFLGKQFSMNIPYPSLSFYAKGGFPEDGLFMANSGELVGQFSNGKTAVANNEQIIEGIERGVYNAMMSALGSTGGRNDDRPIELVMDGRVLAEGLYPYQKDVATRHGVALVT
jgi:hypothetical protein